MRTEITAQDPLATSLVWIGTIARWQGLKVVTNSSRLCNMPMIYPTRRAKSEQYYHIILPRMENAMPYHTT